ncbi:MAG TPA: DUF1015 domain-containing protein [Dehalococcoidia bacterium]|nr:DUF1015 domain-containing protein [Dehalococcoidia bacterium]
MAETRPFRGLRYAATDLSALVCPPYDVISPEEQRRLYERSPFNAARLEYGETLPNDAPSHNRYTRAATTLRQWIESSVLVRDEAPPAFYVDDQQFMHEGRRLTRCSLFARVRLHEWGDGPIRPHERTLSLPKEDRLQLLRACRLNISPILSLYRDDDARVREAVEASRRSARLLATAEVNGERHTIHRIDGEAALEPLASLLQEKTFYVIDGHHRYETALAYLKERRPQAGAWTGEEPENFVLMALVARDDPGVVVLPTHRVLKSVALPDNVVACLESDFAIEDVTASLRDGGWQEMKSRLSRAAEGGVVLGLAIRHGRRFVLRVRDPAAIARQMPDSPVSWQSLDAAVLEEIVLRGIVGIDQQSAAAEGSLEFTHDGEQALGLVESGAAYATFLLSPASVDRVLEIADAGERMPQKSTYLYPKLPAGLVMNLLN